MTADVIPAAGSAAGAEADHGTRCKRTGCTRLVTTGERGRSREFCSDQCRRRHYNALRSTAPAGQAASAADGPLFSVIHGVHEGAGQRVCRRAELAPSGRLPDGACVVRVAWWWSVCRGCGVLGDGGAGG